MYEEFYNLKEKPFSKTPDPRYLYRSPYHAEALARLQYAVEEREMAVLTGEIGSGKTLLSRALIDSLDDTYPIVLIVNPRLSASQFLRVVAQRLGADITGLDRAGLVDQIHELLSRYDDKGKCPVIILDESHLITEKSTFDEIRLLTNFQLDSRNLLSVILIGQPELRQRMLQGPYRALRQRIGIQFHLRPLSMAETREYIQFRVGVAGRTAPLFSDAAYSRIYQLSHGIPREINNICAGSLLEGYGRDTSVIDVDVIDDVGKDLGFALVSTAVRSGDPAKGPEGRSRSRRGKARPAPRPRRKRTHRAGRGPGRRRRTPLRRGKTTRRPAAIRARTRRRRRRDARTGRLR